MSVEINVSKAAEDYHLRVAALPLINERTSYELELTVSYLIQSDCFRNTSLHCQYLRVYSGWR